mgnify:CR=1 FL=1
MTTEVVLKRPPQGSLRFGHPWIYRNQIKDVSLGAQAGQVLSVVTESGKLMGKGYWNPNSEITLRLLTRRDESIDADFFRTRIRKALELRKKGAMESDACRVVSSEADDLAGLIVDRYAEVLVVQFLTLGMEKMRELILPVLREILPNRGIYERSDSPSRKLEGLSERVGWIEKNCNEEVVIHEKDVEIVIRFGEGHKTGWYLDQRENRALLREVAEPGGEALDVFCYEGAFGLQLARAGMRVLGIDSQKDVLRRAEEHRQRNGIPETQLHFEAANAFERLKELEKNGRMFDLIVLDPPSFVKQKTALGGALSGYKELLLRAFRMLNENGKLAVFSCAYHLDDHLLMQACLSAAQDAKRPLKILRFMKQASDHPINPFIPETYYLKGFLFQVFNL